MKIKSINLAWITVTNLKQAIQFYTETLGLKLQELSEEWGWAELTSEDEEGFRLGIALASQDKDADVSCPIKPGQNAVLTYTVDNLENAITHFKNKEASLIGKIEEVPGHVKMQTLKDCDGNVFQVVELLHTSH